MRFQESEVSRRHVLVMVSLGALLAPLNSTMLAVALPEIRSGFGLSHGAIGWLVSTYLIAMAVVQPVAGRLGDELGRMTVFRVALVTFLLCSIGAVFAPSFVVLVAWRTLQAVSGAVIIPNGIGMLRAAVPANRFGTFSGMNSAVIGATAAAGPLVGAAVLAFAPWRALFLVNVPVVLVASLLAWRLNGFGERTHRSTAGFDPVGLVAFGAVLASATWLLTSIRSGAATPRLSALALVLVTAGFLVVQQRRQSAPVAAWSLFRLRGFLGASTHILLMNLAMYTTLLAVPFFITDVQHRGETIAGVLLGAMAALQAVSAPVAGRLSDSVGRRLPSIASSVVAVVAAVMLVAGVNETTPAWFMAIAVTILGLGVGVGFVTASAAAIESVPTSLSGSAAGTQSMMRYVGSILGTGILTGLLATNGDAAGVGTFRLMFLFVAAMAALSVIAATLVRPFPSRA